MVQKTPPTLFWEKCHNGAFAVSNQHHYDFSPEQTWSTFMTFLLLSRNRTIMTFLQNRHAAPLWLFSFFPKTAPLWLFSRTDMQHLCDFSPEQTCSTFVTFLQGSRKPEFLGVRHARKPYEKSSIWARQARKISGWYGNFKILTKTQNSSRCVYCHEYSYHHNDSKGPEAMQEKKTMAREPLKSKHVSILF